MTAFYKITSRENPKLKAVRRIRDGRDRSRIFIEGVRLVTEALQSDLEISEAFLSSGFVGNVRNPDLIDVLKSRGTPVYELPNGIFRTVADTENAQGIVVTAHRPPSRDFRRFGPGEGFLVIFLDRINNPSNLGAVIRTAEAAGAAGIIISPDSADAFSPKALRASMGSAFRLPISMSVDLGEALEWASSNNIVTAAADVGGTEPYTQADWTLPRLLVFGSEAHGLDEKDLRKMDEKLFIPMNSLVESLNLAVSCGIILFEARRQIELARERNHSE